MDVVPLKLVIIHPCPGHDDLATAGLGADLCWRGQTRRRDLDDGSQPAHIASCIEGHNAEEIAGQGPQSRVHVPADVRPYRVNGNHSTSPRFSPQHDVPRQPGDLAPIGVAQWRTPLHDDLPRHVLICQSCHAAGSFWTDLISRYRGSLEGRQLAAQPRCVHSCDAVEVGSAIGVEGVDETDLARGYLGRAVPVPGHEHILGRRLLGPVHGIPGQIPIGHRLPLKPDETDTRLCGQARGRCRALPNEVGLGIQRIAALAITGQAEKSRQGSYWYQNEALESHGKRCSCLRCDVQKNR